MGLCLYPQVQTDGSAATKLKSKQKVATLFLLCRTFNVDDFFFRPDKKIVLGVSTNYQPTALSTLTQKDLFSNLIKAEEKYKLEPIEL